MSLPSAGPRRDPPVRPRSALLRPGTAALLVLLLAAGPAAPGAAALHGQDGAGAPPSGSLAAAAPGGSAVTTAAENFRSEPNGTILARVEPDVHLRVEAAGDAWVEGDLEGWVWARSLQIRSEGEFDLVVSADEGENLRAEPSGAVRARLVRGTLLEELERVPGWIRVRRRGWIWRPSVRLETGSGVAEGGAPTGAAVPRTGGSADAAGPPAGGGSPAVGESDAAAGAEPASRGPGGVGSSWRRAPEGGAPLLTAPDGDTLGRLAPGSEIRVLGRDGGWARVRMEGWAWLPGEDAPTAGSGAVRSDVRPADVSADPAAWVGRIVEWDLQFVSLERAEEVRTDFYRDEPFLLTRTSGPERSFVYVAVPPERLDEVRGLVPLERIRVVGRVRTGASTFTGSPILDLLDLSRQGTGGESGGAESPAVDRP